MEVHRGWRDALAHREDVQNNDEMMSTTGVCKSTSRRNPDIRAHNWNKNREEQQTKTKGRERAREIKQARTVLKKASTMTPKADSCPSTSTTAVHGGSGLYSHTSKTSHAKQTLRRVCGK